MIDIPTVITLDGQSGGCGVSHPTTENFAWDYSGHGFVRHMLWPYGLPYGDGGSDRTAYVGKGFKGAADWNYYQEGSSSEFDWIWRPTSKRL